MSSTKRRTLLAPVTSISLQRDGLHLVARTYSAPSKKLSKKTALKGRLK
jgi:hypothetical protein